MFQQDVLDLLELDPVAADLHLMVDAAEALERTIGAPAGQIAGPVQACLAAARERITRELLLRLFGIVEIAAADAGSADTELADQPDRHRLRMRIEHIEARVGDRAADRHSQRILPEPPSSGAMQRRPNTRTIRRR